MQEVRFLSALQSENHGRPPVWLMRQAGRYMPSYRRLRGKYPLKTLFLTPELASDITLMPVALLGVDAAILFSDISVIALSMGLNLDFSEGPRVDPYLTLDNIPNCFDLEKLDPILAAIRLTVPRLNVPLIGFCGAPFTVASYLIEGGLAKAKQLAHSHPDRFSLLLDAFCAVSVVYMQRQIEAGVQAFQIFDSWANVLSEEEFAKFCMPYYRKMIEAASVPLILFMRGGGHRLDSLTKLDAALSLDWHVSLPEVRRQTKQVLQGNLDPDLLFAPLDFIRNQAKELTASMKGDPGFIAGLGHGVKPDTPFEAVQALVQTLQEG